MGQIYRNLVESAENFSKYLTDVDKDTKSDTDSDRKTAHTQTQANTDMKIMGKV